MSSFSQILEILVVLIPRRKKPTGSSS